LLTLGKASLGLGTGGGVTLGSNGVSFIRLGRVALFGSDHWAPFQLRTFSRGDNPKVQCMWCSECGGRFVAADCFSCSCYKARGGRRDPKSPRLVPLQAWRPPRQCLHNILNGDSSHPCCGGDRGVPGAFGVECRVEGGLRSGRSHAFARRLDTADRSEPRRRGMASSHGAPSKNTQHICIISNG